ncbi:hypothetical protein HK100_004815 [Physocladia obscura]|uniref:chitin synthase n=1 Tax=Physocladia obscura TaxID=109957 RepID=A0AAD5XFM9_9FUNG|nr:hypothetical protein HK100_004815 [Physocladia obscura]
MRSVNLSSTSRSSSVPDDIESLDAYGTQGTLTLSDEDMSNYPRTNTFQNDKSPSQSSRYNTDDLIQSQNSYLQASSFTTLTIGDYEFTPATKAVKATARKQINPVKSTHKPTVLSSIFHIWSPFWFFGTIVLTGTIVATVYTSETLITVILSTLVFLAIPELLVFIIAFGSNFINVIKNPEHSTSRILAVFMLLLTTSIRCCFVCFLFLAPAFGNRLTGNQQIIVNGLQHIFMYVVSGWWIVTICIPPVMATVYSFKYGSGNRRLTLNNGTTFSDSNLPRFILILPVFNEELSLLIAGIDSILDSDYNPSKIVLHVAFDSYEISALYLGLLNATIYLHRWHHGGKRTAQASTWKFIQEKTTVNPDDVIILTDSDNYTYSNALNNLAVLFHENPQKLAYAGYMSCMSTPPKWYKLNMIRILQDTEYVCSENNRVFELALGSVNCLPGAFTAIRYTALQTIAPLYFEVDLPDSTITQYHQYKLGEDRYLTHLVHVNFKPFTIGFCPAVRCETDPPDTIMKFIKQRRRWMLGAVANEAYMLATPSLWLKFPLLLFFKTLQMSWRATSFSQFVVFANALWLLIQHPSNMKIYLISVLVPFGLAWISSTYLGLIVSKPKTGLMWPILIAFQTCIQVFIDWYSIKTWNWKTWGGPRSAISTV